MAGEQIDVMTTRVSFFFGWGRSCRVRNVNEVAAEYAILNRPASELIDTPFPAASNVYEIDAFWNGYFNGKHEERANG